MTPLFNSYRDLLYEGPQTQNTKKHPRWCFFVLGVFPPLAEYETTPIGVWFRVRLYESNMGRVQHPSCLCFFPCHTTAVVQHLRCAFFFCFALSVHIFLILMQQGGYNTLLVRVFFIIQDPRRCCFFCFQLDEGGLPLLVVFFLFSRTREGSTPSLFEFLSLPNNGEGSTPSLLLFHMWRGGFAPFLSCKYS